MTLLSYKSIPFNAGDGYILVNGEENLYLIEALLVAREIPYLDGRYDVLLINQPEDFLEHFYKPVNNPAEEVSKIIAVNPDLKSLKSRNLSLEHIYEGYKKISPVYTNEFGYERDINSRIEILLLRNLGLNTKFILDLAQRSEEKGVLFYKNKIVNQLKDFLIHFNES